MNTAILFQGQRFRVERAVQVTPDGLKCLWRDKRNMQNHWATSICRDGFLYGVHGRHEQENRNVL